MQPVGTLAAAELAAPPDDVEAVVDVDLKQLLEAEGERLPVGMLRFVVFADATGVDPSPNQEASKPSCLGAT